MYIKPKEYIRELEQRVKELKDELSEIEPVLDALKSTYKEGSSIQENKQTTAVVVELTPSEKIAIAQKERHKKERDAKVPIIKNCLIECGPLSLKGISEKVKITAAAVKNIVTENPNEFKKNSHNNLWEVVK